MKTDNTKRGRRSIFENDPWGVVRYFRELTTEQLVKKQKLLLRELRKVNTELLTRHSKARR